MEGLGDPVNVTSALEVVLKRYALAYKFTFYLLTYLETNRKLRREITTSLQSHQKFLEKTNVCQRPPPTLHPDVAVVS